MKTVCNDSKNQVLFSCGTHDGTFHADEVTACALLCLFGLIEVDKIVRTRDPEVLARCQYVCDVGGVYDPKIKRFDHHQVEYQGFFSSAGMILKYLLSQKFMTKREYDHFNHLLVMGVDAHDNGRDPSILGYCSFSHIISNFTPIDYECSPAEQEEAFHQALQFTLAHLKRLKARFEYTTSCKAAVKEAMQKMDPKKRCLIFAKNMPWIDAFFDLGGQSHQALFVVMPSGKHWKLRAIPPSYKERMKVRHPLPEKWAGLLEEELKQVSQIKEAIFCHKGRFISVWKTKEAALQALDETLKNLPDRH